MAGKKKWKLRLPKGFLSATGLLSPHARISLRGSPGGSAPSCVCEEYTCQQPPGSIFNPLRANKQGGGGRVREKSQYGRETRLAADWFLAPPFNRCRPRKTTAPDAYWSASLSLHLFPSAAGQPLVPPLPFALADVPCAKKEWGGRLVFGGKKNSR